MARLLGLLLAAEICLAGSAADLARDIREASLDAAECYRIREVTLAREDARFYFTDGYLIFGKPVGSARISAVFTADVEGGDAEVILLPPHRSERRTLASYTGSPNLNEHFVAAVMSFSDDTYLALMEQIRANPFNRKAPDMGLLLAEKWTPVARNIGASYETRLVLDLLSPSKGFFTAAISGKTLGSFDVSYDPRGSEQILVGQVVYRENRTFYDIWTSFEARSFRNGSRAVEPEFTLSDYRIKATLEPDLTLRAVTRVKMKSSRPEEVLPFDVARQMRILEARVDGQPAEVLQRESLRSNLIRNSGNDLFLVAPPRRLEAQREHEIEFRQEGKVVFEAGNRVYYVGARSNWYPSRGMQFATFDLTFRYPKDLDLVTAGEVAEDRAEGEWRTTRRRIAAPIRIAGFNLGAYERTRVSRAGYIVEVYANRTVERELLPKPEPLLTPPPAPWGRPPRRPEILPVPPQSAPPNPVSRLQQLAADVAAALEFMAARFGPPPLRMLTVSPVPGTFGQGFPGLIYLSTLTYLRPQSKPLQSLNVRQQLFFSEILQAHEVAHQWWGNVVASAGYHDDWLMEALANYSALMYLEKHKGARTLEAALAEYKTNLFKRTESGQEVEAAGPIVLGGRLSSSLAPEAWRAITYGKGSWIVHMLRHQMGDPRFFTMLGELRRRYEHKPLGTEQFRQLAAEFLPPKSADPNLEGFFEQWVYGTGVPALKLSYSVKGKAPAWRLSGTVTQTGVDEHFSVPVPIEIHFARGKPITHIIHSGGTPAPFALSLKQAPTRVVLDPAGIILRR